MMQPDLFALQTAPRQVETSPPRQTGMAGILERLTALSARPRYNFMVLSLIAEASATTGAAGPYVLEDGTHVPIRDWLCAAMMPVAQRDPRRLTLTEKIRSELNAGAARNADPDATERAVEAEVKRRLMLSGRTNVSRAVTELVRIGLLRRHYQGYRVDHHNRGAQRQAVYTITDETRRALSRGR